MAYAVTDPRIAQALALVGTQRSERCPRCGALASAATILGKPHSVMSAAISCGLIDPQQLQAVYRAYRKAKEAT